MTTIARSSCQATPRPSGSSRTLDVQVIAYQAAAIMLAFAVPTIAAMLLDERSLSGVSVWDKPLKFELALFLHLLTIGLLSRVLSGEMATKRWIRYAYGVSAIAAIGEISYIVLQAARARQSHFNFDTPLESFMYGMMGVGATALVVCAFAIGLGILKGGNPSAGRGLQSGAAWGLMLGAVGTLVTAGVMSAGLVAGPGHWVGSVHSDAHGMPLTGWSMNGGDLRVAHFFATHMMQILPVVGMGSDRWCPRRARELVWLSAAAAVMLVVATFVQAASGRAFL